MVRFLRFTIAAFTAMRITLTAKKSGRTAAQQRKHPNMGKTNEENVKTGQQETNEPWKKPDQSDHHPDKDSPNPRPRRPEDNKTA